MHAEFDHFGTTTTRLRVGPIDGEVDFDRDAQRGSLSVRIATTRITSGVPPLDVRLRERDLLATDEFPEAFFVADRFAFDGTRLREVRGEFTLRGTSRPLALRAVRFNCYPSPIFKREVCGGDFEAEILRSEYGMTHLLPFVGDRVRLLHHRRSGGAIALQSPCGKQAAAMREYAGTEAWPRVSPVATRARRNSIFEEPVRSIEGDIPYDAIRSLTTSPLPQDERHHGRRGRRHRHADGVDGADGDAALPEHLAVEGHLPRVRATTSPRRSTTWPAAG